MRIALVHYSYPPVVGGVERIMAEHAKLFADRGHAVTVVCFEGTSSDPRIALALIARAESGALRTQLLPIIKQQDVVIMHNVATMPFHLPLTEVLWQAAEELHGTRFIAWVHDFAPTHPDMPVLDDPRVNLLRTPHPCYEYVAVSPQRLARWAEHVKGAHCSIIPNGVDPAVVLGLTPMIATLAATFGLHTADLVLLQPARLVRRKNVEFSLRLLAKLRTQMDARLVVTAAADPHNVRSQSYREELLRLAGELGISEHVIFAGDHGPVEDADVSSLYRLADALLFPSRDEGFGLPIIEGALHRLPLIVADFPGMEHLAISPAVHVPLDATEEEIVNVAKRILEMHQSSDLTANRSKAKEVLWPAIWKKYLKPLLQHKAETYPFQ